MLQNSIFAEGIQYTSSSSQEEQAADVSLHYANEHSMDPFLATETLPISNTSPTGKDFQSSQEDPAVYSSVAATRTLQQKIDRSTFLFKQWNQPFIFTENPVNHYIDGEVHKADLFRHADTMYKELPFPCTYFFKHQYDSSDGFKGKGWEKLKKDLCLAAIENGFKIEVNSSDGKKDRSPYRLFKCFSGVVYRGNVEDESLKTHRSFSDTNDKKRNTRGKAGLNMARRAEFSRAASSECACPFQLKIGFDETGFFVYNGVGNNNHCGHLKSDKPSHILPSRLIPQEELDRCTEIAQTSTGTSGAAAVYRQRNKSSISRADLYHHSQKAAAAKDAAAGRTKDLSDPDKIASLFIEKGYPYMALYSEYADDENKDLNIMYDAYDVDEAELMKDCAMELLKYPLDDLPDAKEFMEERLKHILLKKHQKLLVAFAWTTPLQKKLFTMHPEVMSVDTVKGTCNESRPLLTVTGRTPNGTTFFILKSYLPHERAWVFRWIFNIVFPKLFPKEVLRKVIIIITDGDAQEMQAVDESIGEFFIFAIRVRCGWHIIDRGFFRLGPKCGKSMKKKDKNAYKRIKKILKAWMYTWCTRRCRTKEEFQVSYFLFYKFATSNYVISLCGEQFVTVMKHFMRAFLQKSLFNFVYYKRAGRRSFQQYSNSAHEGTNRSLKYGGYGLKKTFGLYKSVGILANKEDDHEGLYCTEVSKSSNSQAAWTNMSAKTKLNKRGLYLLHRKWELRKTMHCARFSTTQWKVGKNADVLSKWKKSVIPKFYCVSTVTITNRVAKCDCEYFEEMGVACECIFCVLSSFPFYTEPTHRDVSVKYWTEYSFFLLNESKSNDTTNEMFRLLAENDITGPYCPETYYENVPIVEESELPFGLNVKGSQCLNFDVSKITSNMIDAVLDPAGLQSVHYDTKDEASSDDYSDDSSIELESDSDAEDDESDMDLGKILDTSPDLFDSNIDINDKGTADIYSTLCNTEGTQDHTSFTQELNIAFEQQDKSSDGDDDILQGSRKEVYNVLHPAFSNLTEFMENNYDEQDVSDVFKFFDQKTNDICQRRQNGIVQRGTLVSCNPQSSSKKRKHHGCGQH